MRSLERVFRDASPRVGLPREGAFSTAWRNGLDSHLRVCCLGQRRDFVRWGRRGMDAARLIEPAALRPGDRVAVVTPSGPVGRRRGFARGAVRLGAGLAPPDRGSVPVIGVTAHPHIEGIAARAVERGVLPGVEPLVS